MDRLCGCLLSSLALPLWIHPCGCSFAQEPWLTLVTPIPLSLGRWYWWLPTLLISRLTQCPLFGFSALPCPAKPIPVFKPPCFQYFGGFYFLGRLCLTPSLTRHPASTQTAQEVVLLTSQPGRSVSSRRQRHLKATGERWFDMWMDENCIKGGSKKNFLGRERNVQRFVVYSE